MPAEGQVQAARPLARWLQGKAVAAAASAFGRGGSDTAENNEDRDTTEQ